MNKWLLPLPLKIVRYKRYTATDYCRNVLERSGKPL